MLRRAMIQGKVFSIDFFINREFKGSVCSLSITTFYFCLCIFGCLLPLNVWFIKLEPCLPYSLLCLQWLQESMIHSSYLKNKIFVISKTVPMHIYETVALSSPSIAFLAYERIYIQNYTSSTLESLPLLFFQHSLLLIVKNKTRQPWSFWLLFFYPFL